MKLKTASKENGTANSLDAEIVKMEMLLSSIDDVKDFEKMPKKDLMAHVLRLGILIARLTNSQSRIVDVIGTSAKITQSIIHELKYIFYIAIIALFKDEVIVIFGKVWTFLIQYLNWGGYLFKNLSSDQYFYLFYGFPAISIFTYFLQKNNREKFVSFVKKLVSKFN